ncbi:MAG: hypothetical protein LBF26_03160 [Puniceicoccales bacterium]|jgi:hypothetical protein|nr:hypothetical protein [Puniceicoccales bacterium]
MFGSKVNCKDVVRACGIYDAQLAGMDESVGIKLFFNVLTLKLHAASVVAAFKAGLPAVAAVAFLEYQVVLGTDADVSQLLRAELQGLRAQADCEKAKNPDACQRMMVERQKLVAGTYIYKRDNGNDLRVVVE